jgi:hypothetical protein
MDILLIVACRQALNLFEATEKSFNGVTLGLIGPVVEPWVVPTPGRDKGLRAPVTSATTKGAKSQLQAVKRRTGVRPLSSGKAR